MCSSLQLHSRQIKWLSSVSQSLCLFDIIAPKEKIEFPDYTFDDHFKRALPTFMPRSLILDYMLARCTKDNKTFFNSVKFNTNVKSVDFNDELQKFIIQTIDLETDCASVEHFDKCIWAAGENGHPRIPKSVSDILSSPLGGFKGDIMHSCEVGSDFDKLVKGKKVLFVGDSYSAEDLALQAIKLGVKSVDVLSRSGEGAVVCTRSWPEDRVKVHKYYEITGVSEDGRSIVIDIKDEDNNEDEGNDEEVEMTLKNIDTVVYCTGYEANMEMLNSSLRFRLHDDKRGHFFEDYEGLDNRKKTWKMKKNHITEIIGDVPPVGELNGYQLTYPDLYRGHLISNPNMMFYTDRSEAPLLDADIQSWLLLAHITGDLSLPSITGMKQFNLDALFDELQDPYYRSEIDKSYCEAWDKAPAMEDEEHWYYQHGHEKKRDLERNFALFECRFLARDILDAKYPFDIGTYHELNEKGKAFVEISLSSFDAHEVDLVKGMTFRDHNPVNIRSVMTGTKAIPLKQPWLELEGDSPEDICGHDDDITSNES